MTQEQREWLFYIVWFASRGDEPAKNELCEILALKLKPRIQWTLRKTRVPRLDLEDALQDVILRVFERVKQVRECRAFLSWLARIAREIGRKYVAHQHLSTQHRDAEERTTRHRAIGRKWVSIDGQLRAIKLFGPETFNERSSTKQSLVEPLTDDILRRQSQRNVPDYPQQIDLCRALNRLDAAERDATLIRYQEGLERGETAQVLGRTEGSVDRLVKNSRQQLRNSLPGYDLNVRTRSPVSVREPKREVASTGRTASSHKA